MGISTDSPELVPSLGAPSLSVGSAQNQDAFKLAHSLSSHPNLCTALLNYHVQRPSSSHYVCQFE